MHNDNSLFPSLVFGKMDSIWVAKEKDLYKDPAKNENQRTIYVQSIISMALGLIAFLTFCVSLLDIATSYGDDADTVVEKFLRPRWASLYAARKKQKNAASILPELPDSFLGWVPRLYRITEDEVLASAGLDAYVVSLLDKPCDRVRV